MSKPSRPTKTAKVVVELPEGLPEKNEDANEQTLPFLARAAAPEDVKESPSCCHSGIFIPRRRNLNVRNEGQCAG